jgi:hypothetical protein
MGEKVVEDQVRKYGATRVVGELLVGQPGPGIMGLKLRGSGASCASGPIR